jgi:hypothetical protein
LRPQTADAAVGRPPEPALHQHQHQQAGQERSAYVYRPASVNSARVAEYFGRAPNSARGAGCDADLDGSLRYCHAAGGGGGSGVAAHARLYADHFRKQQRLQEERRLRWVGASEVARRHGSGSRVSAALGHG